MTPTEQRFPVTGWTIESYVAHNEALRRAEAAFMAERDRRYTENDVANKDALKAALTAAEKASEKTETALKEYKTASNEWRDTVKDLVANMVTRQDVERELKQIEIRLGEMREHQAIGTGKTEGISAVWGIVLGAVGLLAGLVAVVAFALNMSRTAAPAAPSQQQQPQIIYVPAAPGTLIPSTQPPSPP